jgi:hypothetical protein
MLRGDLEIECLHGGIDGASDDDDILLPRMLFMAFLIVPCCKNSPTTLPGVSCQKKNAQRKYMEGQEL